MKKMTETQFIDACNEYGNSWDKEFAVSWTTGGNYCDCWGGNYAVTPDAPEELRCLDSFIMKYFPTISFMEGRMIFGAVTTTDTREGDYYGGCQYGVKKYITYSNLRDVLERLELLEIITGDVDENDE